MVRRNLFGLCLFSYPIGRAVGNPFPVTLVTPYRLSGTDSHPGMGDGMGDVVYFYHFIFSISIFRIALAMAEVQTPT